MPAHNYVPIPTDNDVFPPYYNTGIPSTAPPSFHSLPLSAARPSLHLPHRNDENAATIMPAEMFERPRNRPPMPASLAGEETYPVSIWAPSTMGSEMGVDLEAAREDVLARLLERVEGLERRFEERGRVGEEEGERKGERKGERWSRLDCLGLVAAVLFVIWICFTVTFAVAVRYRAAGHKE